MRKSLLMHGNVNWLGINNVHAYDEAIMLTLYVLIELKNKCLSRTNWLTGTTI